MLPTRLLFDDFLDDWKANSSYNSMSCDIYEKDGIYHIEMDAPGFSKKDITIECDKGNLKIIAEKKSEEHDDKKYLHRERKSYQKCERSFYLGNVNEDDIKAEFKDGILLITVPKEDKTETKRTIEID